VGSPSFALTVGAWIALELGLLVRDAARGRGGPAQDRGTRRLVFLALAGALALGSGLAHLFRADPGLWLPGHGTDAPLATGLGLMWAGLALRVWSIASLGAAFRLTVEVDPGQPVVDRGPYRRVRHPSYTGLLLIAAGYGVVTAVWPSLLLAVVLPLAVLVRRIHVEERALEVGLGEPYRAYETRTKRLVPGVW